jgi:putative membrane protein
MTIENFPALNATLNSLSTLFIAAGWLLIRRGQKKAHIACMVSALVTSSAFLTCYLIYHFNVLTVRFTHPGPVKWFYYGMLLTHVVLAIAVVPLVLMTVVPALQQRFERHRVMGRWTMPIWLYVSVTGVLVYFMLYRWFPSDDLKQRGRAEAALVAPGRG